MPLQLPSTDPKPLAPGLYATDAFHRRPLFAVNGQVVRSWNEAHALHGPARLDDINPAYVAALISGKFDAQAAPYKLIQRLQRAHHVRVGSDGMVQTHGYDPLAGGASAMDADSLHQFLRQGLIDHLERTLEGHAGAIGCEHSSGLDSNAVLGGLVHGMGIDPKRIHTWSHEGSGESAHLMTFRAFHRLNPKQCHRFEPADTGCEKSLDAVQLQLAVFGAPAQIGGNSQSVELISQLGCTVLFSGFGGDQALSHNATNVPTDLVAQGRWGELTSWVGGRRRSLKHIIGRSLVLRNRQLAEFLVLRRTRSVFSSGLLHRTLTPEGRQWLGPHLNQRYPWEFDNYLKQHESISMRVLSDWVAVRVEDETRLAAFNGVAKVFPLLDEKLIGSLLRQDPTLFGEGAGRGRLIHRRAFAPFLPPFLRTNPSKSRLSEDELKRWRAELKKQRKQALEQSAATIKDWHPSILYYWDVDAIKREVEELVSSPGSSLNRVAHSLREINSMMALSGWFQALEC